MLEVFHYVSAIGYRIFVIYDQEQEAVLLLISEKDKWPLATSEIASEKLKGRVKDAIKMIAKGSPGWPLDSQEDHRLRLSSFLELLTVAHISEGEVEEKLREVSKGEQPVWDASDFTRWRKNQDKIESEEE